MSTSRMPSWPGSTACGGYAALRARGCDFVIVESRCSYLQPARLDEVVTIEVRPVSAGRTAFTVAFDMKRHGAAIVTAAVTYVAAREGRPAELPPIVRPGRRCPPGALSGPRGGGTAGCRLLPPAPPAFDDIWRGPP